jgi:flagellar capping protein FliD
VVPDTSIASNAITSFVDAYNSFKLFASAQNQRNADGTPTEDAVLANDPTLRSIVSQVNDQVTAVVNGITSGDPERLQDVGISFDDFAGDDNNPETKNIMTIDTDALSSALTANFQGVANLFEYNLTSDNTSLTTYARTKNLDVTAMTLSLDRTNGVYTATYTDSNNQSQVVSLTAAPIGSSTSLTLSAPAGSGLEGLTLIYTSTADATIHATITQGIGDTIYNALTGMIDSTNGTLTKAMETITNQENRNTTEITKINDQMVTYRERLTQQYANLEAALTKANQLLQLLQAQADARLAAAGG